jgi:hypothetical protein
MIHTQSVLAAINSVTHFTVMPPPCAKLCRHPVQRYAATRLGIQNIIHAEGVFGKNEVAQMYGPPPDCKGKVDG